MICDRHASLVRKALSRAQVTPDRHQASARKMKFKTIAKWNVRTRVQNGNCSQERKRMKINILALNEARWQGAEKIASEMFESFSLQEVQHMRKEWLL